MSKILIVEDEVAIADLEKDYLELSGFEVMLEYTGDAGLKRALEEDIDLLILDIMLPNMDGFDICKEVRQKKRYPDYYGICQERRYFKDKRTWIWRR